MAYQDPLSELPMGFGMALMQDPTAMEWFSALSAPAQQAILERTHSIRSKEEMKAFVSQMGREQTGFH